MARSLRRRARLGGTSVQGSSSEGAGYAEVTREVTDG